LKADCQSTIDSQVKTIQSLVKTSDHRTVLAYITAGYTPSVPPFNTRENNRKLPLPNLCAAASGVQRRTGWHFRWSIALTSSFPISQRNQKLKQLIFCRGGIRNLKRFPRNSIKARGGARNCAIDGREKREQVLKTQKT
jgi:hypothetical protein